MINNNFFIQNRKNLINNLERKSVVILPSKKEYLKNGDQLYNYRQSSNFFYLCGILQEKSILLLNLANKNEDNQEILFIRRSNPNLEIWNGHKLTIKEAQEISGIKTVMYIDEFDGICNKIVQNNDNIYLNISENIHFDDDIFREDIEFTNKIANKFPLHHKLRLYPILEKLRLIKSEIEIEFIRKACQITAKAFHKVLINVKPDIYEYQIQALIDYEFKYNNSEHAYSPIIAGGQNACCLHYLENKALCKNNSLILMDFGATYNLYSADLSRTIPINGKFTEFQAKVYNSVLYVFKKCKEFIKPGISINDINNFANKLIEEELIKLSLINAAQEQIDGKPAFRKYFMHGTSHFLGLDVHDIGEKDTVLEKGMIITCEPGIYIAEEKLGIRIETDLLITDDSCEDLMIDVPVEINEIEDLMRKN